jgi:hypothetical protein
VTHISDLNGIEVEHLLGGRMGPLVKIRCLSTGAVLIGQVSPAAAREIAAHLLEAAARAEYEGDLHSTMDSEGWTDQMMGAVLHMVRQGEEHRHNQGETT